MPLIDIENDLPPPAGRQGARLHRGRIPRGCGDRVEAGGRLHQHHARGARRIEALFVPCGRDGISNLISGCLMNLIMKIIKIKMNNFVTIILIIVVFKFYQR